jgi:hypothetical protein
MDKGFESSPRHESNVRTRFRNLRAKTLFAGEKSL